MSDQVFKFDDPFRPIWELQSVAIWMAVCAGALLLQASMNANTWVFTAFAIASFGFAALRAVAAARLWTMQRNLAGTPVSFTSRAELIEQTKGEGERMFLGYGFEWTQEHAQLVHQLLRSDPKGLAPADDANGKAMGKPWIHGIGKSEEVPIWIPLEQTAGHMLLVGTTRAGKTRILDTIITQAIRRGEPVIVWDPKGDKGLRDTVKNACAAVGRPNDFIFVHPAFPEQSWRIDPLKNFNRATELASRPAALIGNDGGTDPFSAHAMSVMTHLCEGMLMIGMKPTIKQIARFVDNGPEWLVVRACEAHFEKCVPDWKEQAKPFIKSRRNDRDIAAGYDAFYVDVVQHRWPNTALNGLLSVFKHDKQHQQKMLASLTPVLTMLTAGALGDLLSPDTEDLTDRRPITDFARVIRNGQAAYLGLDSLSDNMVGSALGSMFTADLTAVSGDRYNYGEGDGEEIKPVTLVIDEAAELVSDKLIQLLNKSGGSLFRLVIATQTFADFAARVGSEAKARMVLGNLNIRIILRTIDGGTQQYLAEQFPKGYVRHLEYSQATDAKTEDPLAFGYRIQESMKETQVPLVEAEVLGCLPNLEFFAQVSGGRILKGRIPIVLDEPEGQGA